jgi:hypothetical protein
MGQFEYRSPELQKTVFIPSGILADHRFRVADNHPELRNRMQTSSMSVVAPVTP